MLKKTDYMPGECDYSAPEYFEYLKDEENWEIAQGLVFHNARDPFYGLTFHNRNELEGFILRLRSAADELWGR